MANYMSREARFPEVRSSINLPLVNQVLAVKQGTYDKNKALIQGALDAFGTQDLLREQDQQYAYEKLSSVTETINNYANNDLSQSFVSDDIMSKIRTAAQDPVILSAVENTRKFRNYQGTVNQIREKNKELYSDTNYAFGLAQAGFDEYMSGTTNNIGNLQYTDYSDVNAKLVEYSKNLDKYADVVKENTPEGLYFVSKEGKRLSEQQIQNQITALLSDKDLRQVRINGWNNFERGRSQEELVSQFSTYSQSKLSDIDANIKLAQTQIDNSNDDNEKNNLTTYLQNLQSQKTSLQDEHNRRLNARDFGNMAYEMEYNNEIGRFAKVFAFDNVSTSYSVNSAAVDQMKLQYKELTGKSTKGEDSNDDGIEDVRQVGLPYAGETTNFLNEEKKQADSFDSAYRQQLTFEYDKLPQTAKDAFELSMRKSPNADREDKLFEYMKGLAQGSSNLVNKGIISNIESLKNKSENYQQNYVTNVKLATEEIEAESLPSIFEGYMSNPDIKVIMSNGRVVSGRKYLQDSGIRSVADLESTPKGKLVKSQLLKSYYADQILSSTDYSVVRNPVMAALNPMSLGITLVSNSPKDSVLANALRSKFSTQAEYDKFLETAEKNGVYDTNNFVDKLVGNIFNSDNSVRDDRGLRNLINVDRINERAGKLLNQNKIVSRNAGIEVQAGTPIHSELISAVGSEFRADDGTQFVANDKSTITIRPVSADIVEVSQVKAATEKSPATKQTAQIKTINLPQTVLQRVDFLGAGNSFTSSNVPEISVPAKYFSKNDVKSIRDIGTNILGSQQEAFNLSKEAVAETLFNPLYQKVTGSYMNPTPVGQVVKNILDNPNNLPPLQAALVKDGNEVFVSIKYKKGNQERTVYTFPDPVPENRLDVIYKEVNYAPQKYVNRVLENMVSNQATYPNSPNYIYNTLAEIYGGN